MEKEPLFTSAGVLQLVEKAYDDGGISDYGCFSEVCIMIRQRATLLDMLSIDASQKQSILKEMHEIITSLPRLHNEALAKKHAIRLQELLPL
jgi:hypothetical protein